MITFDPNWILVILTILGLTGGFIVWLSVLFSDIRFIKRETVKNGITIHKIRNVYNILGLRIALIEQHLDLKPPIVEEVEEDEDKGA